MSPKGSKLLRWIVLFVVIGLLDALYLTYQHFHNPLGTCTVSLFGDCGVVLRSKYAVIFGIPLALIGLVHYLTLGILVWMAYALGDGLYKRFMFIQTAMGLVVSLYLTFLQLFVIRSVCQYCLLSALVNLLLYIAIRRQWNDEYRAFVLAKIEIGYKLFAKPLFFLLPAEWVHDQAMWWGSLAGALPWKRAAVRRVLHYTNTSLKQKIAGITFENPVGLSAGYDYTASFTRILPSIGFGFETVGTITNKESEGNPQPRLGRLPRSKSLLVNKGFRNPGADAIINKLTGQTFAFPLGISIGKTNATDIAGTQKTAIADIVAAFQKFERSKTKHSYYELNISCPNLKGNVTFYEPVKLRELLTALKKLAIKKPVFVKMPIEKSDAEVKKILDVIITFPFITGVIFGNLQKDRKDPSFIKEEIQKAGKGNFSGKPTFRRSNELIQLAYRAYGKRLVIIGCGGVFTADDAYRKIRLGASLIQLITGMIFEGPQRISQINRGLVERLKADGFNTIADAVGTDSI